MADLDQTRHLREIAEAADRDGRPWTWKGGYPQQVLRVDATDVAEALASDSNTPTPTEGSGNGAD